MGPVKDIVRDVWKIAAACAAGAFLLSLVIGLIAGNPFGIAFFRGFLLALLFAGLGAGLRFVVKAYLPELVALNQSAAAYEGANKPADQRGTAESAYGGAVDIVLPEDDGLRRQAYSGSARPTASSSEVTESVGGPEEALDAEWMGEDSTSQAESKALGDLAGELAEELPGAPEAEAVNSRATATLNPRDTTAQNPRDTAARRSTASAAGDEILEEAEPEDELPRSAREPTGEIDSLPDIAALEPPSGVTPGSARYSRLSTLGEKPGDAVRNVLSGQDPATLARALRTVLKKDEKG
jgi:hypothetical protein